MKYSVVELVGGVVAVRSVDLWDAYQMRDDLGDRALKAGKKLTEVRYGLRSAVK